MYKEKIIFVIEKSLLKKDAVVLLKTSYHKNPKNSDWKKFAGEFTADRLMHPKVAYRIANSEDPDQTALSSLHCLPRLICLKT